MQDRGQKIKVRLYMEAHYEKKLGKSHNLVGEIRGSKYPDEIILIGGHIDSWDAGPQTGANDDAAGFFVCYEAVRLLLELNIRPKRTIRFIAWTGEEPGGKGALQYEKTHLSEMGKHVIVFESDLGTTLLEGFSYDGNIKAFSQVKNIINQLMPQYKFKKIKNEMEDIDILLKKHNIPALTTIIKDTPDKQYYFSYHHSAGDTVSVLNKDDMDSNVLGIASLFYSIADLDLPNPIFKVSPHHKK